MKIESIKRNSVRALCGANERELVVDEDEVAQVKRELKANGYFIVGVGDAGFGKKKIWFNPIGGGF